jgi:amino acid transporter
VGFQQERFVDLNSQKGKPANAAVAILAIGCTSVFFAVGMAGGYDVATLVGVVLVALFVFGCVCGAVYLVFTLIARRTPHPRQNRVPMRGGAWWTR